jgi:hypothetical protein
MLYFIFRPLYCVLKPVKGLVTDTASLGNAMIQMVSKGYNKKILDVADINTLAGKR